MSSLSTEPTETSALAGLYLLFASLLSKELDVATRELLLQPDVLSALSKADPDCREYLTGEWDDATYEQAAVAFCDAFILPEKAKQPRAAAWIRDDKSISTDGIHAVVENLLRAYEIQLPDHYAELPYDHASVLFHIAASLRAAESEQVEEFEELALFSWITRFARSLENEECPLYRAVGRMILECGRAA